MANMAANWDDLEDSPHANSTSGLAATSAREGVVQLHLLIGAATGLAKAVLPVFSREMPISGTKEARNSLLKLLAGMNNDVCPLNFRGEYKKNSNEKDPYYKIGPEWTTMSGGNNPVIVCTPLKICEDLSAAAQCVPLVKNEVQIRILEADGTQTDATIEDVRTRNIQPKKVPRQPAHVEQATPAGAPAGVASSSSSSPPSSSEADALRSQVNMQAQHMSALEKQIAELKALIAAPPAPHAPAPPPAPAPAAPAPAAPAPAPAEEDEEQPRPSARAAAKRARRSV